MANPKVITPPTAPVIALATLQAHTKVDVAVGVSPEDALLLDKLLSAHATAEHYTGVALGSQTLELALDAFPDAIKLPNGPVTSITSITYIDAAGDTQALDAADYTLDDYSTPQWVVPAYNTTWPDTLDTVNAVKVRYVAGAAALPAAAKAALLLMVEWLRANRGDAMTEDDIQPPAAKSLLNTIKVYGF